MGGRLLNVVLKRRTYARLFSSYYGFGLFRVGESLGRGFAPVALFPSRWLALVAAAVLPGTGRDPLVRIDKQPDADGVYPLILPSPEGGEVVGRLQLFDEALVDALNVAIHLLQAPESLAWLLEAAGAVALERCGAILDERMTDGEVEVAE